MSKTRAVKKRRPTVKLSEALLAYTTNFTVMRALEELSHGQIASAFGAMGKEMPFGLVDEVEVADPENAPDAFKADMKRLATLMQNFGV